MVFNKLFRALFEFILISSILLIFLYYSPMFLNCDPQAYSVKLPESFKGSLTANSKLSKAEKFLLGDIIWPESLAVHEGIIYTGVNDGHIVKIVGDKVQPIVRTGKVDCQGQWEEEECGRPLGMRFNKDGILYVVDAFYGLLAVDVEKKTSKTLLPPTMNVEGYNLTFLNDLVFDENGIIYMTQSSTKWQLTKVIYALLDHDSTGRLLSFNPNTLELKVLADGLTFPNGIELSHDESKLLVAECTNHGILQYHLKGPKKGQLEPFINDLPGEPDNIRRSVTGGYWVAFNSARTMKTITTSDKLSQYPAIRKVVMRLIYLVGSTLAYLANLVPYTAMKSIAFDIESARFLAELDRPYGLILRIDDSGKIVESLHSPDGTIAFLSEVLEHDGHLYIGSWRNHFLTKLKL